MAYGAASAADEENLLGYGASKPAVPAPAALPQVAVPLAPPVPNPLAGAATPFSAERADLVAGFFRAAWAGCQPWDEFYSTRAFSKPTFDVLSDRIRMNLETFRNNYIIVATVWLSLSVLSGIPTFLLAGVLFFALDKFASRRAAKNEGVLSHEDRIILVVLSLLIVWFTGIFGYVTLSLFLTGLSIAAHAAFHREPEPAVVLTV